MKKVVCVQPARMLTEGQVYTVLNEDGKHYEVTNDGGFEELYYQHYFEEIDVRIVSDSAKPDGASSSYYDLTITRKDGSTVEVTVQDIISSVLKDNWHFGNIFKAMVRIVGKMNGGGKAGTDEHYDANKVVWFAEDFKSRLPK